MTPSVTIGAPQPACSLCAKSGLPILPLRYAVARKGKGNAPKLVAPFDATLSEKTHGQKKGKILKKSNLADLSPNGSTAYFTTRLLRPGYLYVYDERGKWTAYTVAAGSYLLPFNPYAKPPPGGWSKPKFSCKRDASDLVGRARDEQIARCITIENPETATKVWLGFSDVIWTATVLERHSNAHYRDLHMQRLDVAAIIKGANQPHVAPFSELASHVAEYAADATALLKETQAYVQKLLPKPYNAYSAQQLLTDHSSSAKLAVEMLHSLVKDLLSTATGPAGFIETGGYETAAWAFSPQPIAAQSAHVETMLDWSKEAAAPYQAAMIALDDPVGIAMELNGLVLQHLAEITAAPEYRWKYETAASISWLRETVRQGAVEKERNARRFKTRRDLTVDHGPLAAPNLSEKNRQILEDQIAASGDLNDKDIKDTSNSAWEKYAERIHEDDLDTYSAQVQNKLTNATQHLVADLDSPYVAWLDSGTFSRYFTHNFDDTDPASGEAYTLIARLVLSEASGRSAVAGFLRDGLDKDLDDVEQWPIRALTLNHSGFIKQLKESATDTSLSWNDIADKISSVMLTAVAADNHAQLSMRGNQIAQYLRAIAGPMINSIDQSLNHTAGAIAGLSYAHMQIGLLGALVKIDNPDYKVFKLDSQWNRKEATRSLARFLAAQAGGDELMYRSGARQALSQISGAQGEHFNAHGFVFVNSKEGKRLASLSKAQRNATIPEIVLTPPEFEEAMANQIGKLANLEVKAGIVGAIFAALSVRSSFGKLIEAKPGALAKPGTELVGGVSALLGGIFETTGKVMKAANESAPRLAGEIQGYANKAADTTKWLEGAGKWFGVAGGVICVGLLGYEAYDDYKSGNYSLMVANLVLMAGTAGSVYLMFFTVSLGILGLIIGLLVAIAAAVIDWLKDDDLQKWLNKSAFFGDHKDLAWFSDKDSYKPYANPVEQRAALKLLTGAN